MKLNNNIILREMQGDAVLLNIETGDYYSLNHVGNEIVKSINNNLTIEEITNNIVDIYDIDFETAKSDIVSLIEDLILNHILEK